jgi:glutamate synthase (ferredoxin)
MAVAAVHHRLIDAGLRTSASLIVTTGQAWSTHHFACLIGYGASAVVPYGAFAAIVNWHGQKRNQLAMARGDIPPISAEKAMYNFRKSVDKGLLKILSKIGISLLSSYQGAQIFEALGLSDAMVGKVFKGTPCRVPGLTYDDVAAENVEFHRKAFGDDLFSGMLSKVEAGPSKLFNYGFLNFLKSGEYHHNNQPLIKTLHSAIRNHDRDMFRLYEQAVTSRPPTTLRDALKFTEGARPSIPIEEVESVERIMARFVTGGMSLGALGREAHETLAIALNRIGGRSNSGEGGEDPVRRSLIGDVAEDGTSATFPHLKGLKNGDNPGSKIKQVASGRFGVTPAYLMSAEQLEIKIAQGAKPGEGGQLPGPKIDAYIAALRKSKPGVTLISPPPHHDIYSIEDLAQLIYDLHQINPKAAVSVKLVSEVGIGTVASGVAKAGADVIQVAGHDGGTGASPASSIKFAGSPWELGLVETHATLLKNGLRERVLLRVDGGLKSGWDVVMAAALGAEEFGFGTIALIAEGCIMARICHTNKCPVGVTTQNEALRKRFPGTPDNVVTYFGYVAEEVRSILATLGYKSLEEVIGKPGVLQSRANSINLKKTSSLDVSYVLDALECVPKIEQDGCLVDDRSWLQHGPVHDNGYTLDDRVLEDAAVQAAIASQGSAALSLKIKNTDRSSFARVSGVIASKYGDHGFKGSLRFALTGGAGQSFCAFNGQGMDITLRGYANDYVCKGMAGGRVVVSPPAEDDEAAKKSGRATSASKYNVVGNTVLYGATGGSLMVRGRGGERFAVRNSGSLGVIEGLGDHGCEYMTAGSIICLGATGRNFGAGMTGGLALVVEDEDWLDGTGGAGVPAHLAFPKLVNTESVSVVRLSKDYKYAIYHYVTAPHPLLYVLLCCRVMKEYLSNTLRAHADATGSTRAERVLADLDTAMAKFWAVVPASEKANPLLVKVSGRCMLY